MKRTFSMKITNEVILNSEGLTVFEIKNDAEEVPTYDYYVWQPGYTLTHSFGIPQTAERFSAVSLINLYANGYFDGLFDEDAEI